MRLSAMFISQPSAGRRGLSSQVVKRSPVASRDSSPTASMQHRERRALVERLDAGADAAQPALDGVLAQDAVEDQERRHSLHVVGHRREHG